MWIMYMKDALSSLSRKLWTHNSPALNTRSVIAWLDIEHRTGSRVTRSRVQTPLKSYFSFCFSFKLFHAIAQIAFTGARVILHQFREQYALPSSTKESSAATSLLVVDDTGLPSHIRTARFQIAPPPTPPKAKVRENWSITSHSISTDTDECQTGDNDCHSNGDCLNSIGSYSCQCKPGYEGNGFICKCRCSTLIKSYV